MFIGDANHLLSPYEFVGANLTLKNAVSGPSDSRYIIDVCH